MAWIKMRGVLLDEPEVQGIATSLGVSAEHVIGLLLRVWSVADMVAIERPGNAKVTLRALPDGNNGIVCEGFCAHYTRRKIDEIARCENFANLMIREGWLVEYPDGVAFPDWHAHHSNSAKQRACAAKRQSKFKKGNGKVTLRALPDGNATTITREEERREDINSGVTDVTPLARSRAKAHSEPVGPPFEPIIEFPVTGGGGDKWLVPAALVAVEQVAFPALDVPALFRQAAAWCVANPAKRKTAKGMPRFLHAWLERAQNRGGGPAGLAGGPPSEPLFPPGWEDRIGK